MLGFQLRTEARRVEQLVILLMPQVPHVQLSRPVMLLCVPLEHNTRLAGTVIKY